MFGLGKKAELAELSEDAFESVQQALEGNFNLVKPHPCQAPWCGITDETYPLLYTEDQQNSSILNTDTDAYNTASSTEISLNEDIKFDSQDHNKEGSKLQCSDLLMPLPQKTNDIHFHQNQVGKLQRFRSDVAWVHSSTSKNRSNCFDCAAQFSTYDIPTTDAGSTTNPQSSNAPYSHTATHTSCQEETTFNFETSELVAHSKTEEVTLSASTIKDLRKTSPTQNFPKSASACDSTCQGDTSTMDTGAVIMKDVNDICEQMAVLIVHRKENKVLTPQPVQKKKSELDIPVCQLSPQTKIEVKNFLKETADDFDVHHIPLDEKRSSINLLKSIIQEAGRRYGFEEKNWPAKVMSEHLPNERIETLQRILKSDSQLHPPISQADDPSNVRSPRAVRKRTDLMEDKSASDSHCSAGGSKCASVPLCSHKEKTSAAETKKAHSAGKTKSTPNVKQNKPKPNSCKKRKLDSCHDKSGIHFSHAGRYEKCTVGDTTAVSKAAEANGNIVSRRSCHAPKPDDFVTCHQVFKDEKGVGCKSRKNRRTKQPTSKVINNIKKPSVKKEQPSVEQFNISSKTGTHSFFEMLNAKIAIPQFSSKMNICEATVPVHLNSEAVWQNGELHVYIKDLDKDLAHLPAEKKERFTRMPKAIAIDFVREFKEDKLGQSSPCVVKKAIEKTVSPTKDVHKPPQESPRRFNTKVDTIFKKDPLILGTIDRKNFSNRRVIQQQKIKKTSIPAYCVV